MESVSGIMKSFNIGAMSLGSTSQECQEALAIATNPIGRRSNSGKDEVLHGGWWPAKPPS
ncbi:hypothetical protein PC129_g19454 [Phytophthora cactorum]|uniref:Glutamate synthase domain-containing protein n=1 Tax=Phytophthora cactorum TaxID=29920 RepID=A0A329R976_9STRA|nr:hypothetical protein PC111_g19832 [Phytophthora cactorum]KAG2809158.1 hypothetical protein PC112_g16632 [Phytophthora cactorum]KAG2849516.1 hypothetical protein PC113_g17396 [Phytophthora cactorum]KAG2879516.1 hypothetical protein PC114_g22538 [Phytophthora cactorum]KAG2888228.1 hypothetical protein PC115_g20131 [Phytophthora cactorum]